MIRFLIVGALACALIAGAFVLGCGPRAELAKDKVIAQIDKVLGELDVKRKKIEVNQRKLRAEVANLRDKRIGTEVRLEQLESKKASSEKALVDARAKLVKVVELADEAKAGSGTIERNGKTYTTEDIQNSANAAKLRFTSAKGKVDAFQTSIGALTQSVNFLRDQEKTASAAMESLNAKIEQIDMKKVAVDAVKHATSVAGEDASIADRIKGLDKEIDDLFVEVETAMRVEESKLTDVDTNTDLADELLAEPADLDATIAEIDALLGN